MSNLTKRFLINSLILSTKTLVIIIEALKARRAESLVWIFVTKEARFFVRSP